MSGATRARQIPPLIPGLQDRAALVPFVAGRCCSTSTRRRVMPAAMAVWVMGVTLGPIIGPALGGW